MYRPAARHWMTRIARTCQGNLRLTVAIAAAVFIVTLFYWRGFRYVSGHAPVVLVAVFERTDEKGDEVRILDKVLENRWEYANAHGTQFAEETKKRLRTIGVQRHRLSDIC